MIDPARLFAADSETHLVQDGLLAPPGVVWSFATAEPGTERVVWFDAGLDELERVLRSALVLAGFNVSFDLAVALAASRGGRFSGRPELIDLVFEKYERGEVFDAMIGVALDAIADGLLFRDPATGQSLRHPPTPEQAAAGKAGKVAKRYSLEITSRLLLGRHNAKENDAYRLRYAELESVPFEQWPPEARQYPKDDARNHYDVCAALNARGRNLGPLQRHPWTHLTHNARAVWAMHLASVWGLRTDGARVDALTAKVDAAYSRDVERFKATGILRADGRKDTATLKRKVIEAYGGREACTECAGSGKVSGTMKCKGCDVCAPAPMRKDAWPCNGSAGVPGRVPNHKSKVNCKVCGGSGLAFPPTLPVTPAGGVKTDRDTLTESGDDLLESFAMVSENVKLRGTYLPFLRTGITKPINVRSNVLVESGRASYDGLIQLLPRDLGIRECIVAREDTDLNSVDYAALELCTLAQVCLWVVGHSKMAEAINAAKDPGVLHTLLGAKLLGVPPDEFKRLVKAKDKKAAMGRYNAKAANFGFPGLMGAAKLTIAKRKEGIRFCVTFGRAPKCPACEGCKCSGLDKHCAQTHCRHCGGRGFLCGLEKVTEWKQRPIPPTCVTCIECAEELRREWFEQWPEVPEYFEWIKSHDGVSDGLGVITSPGTGYVRGGLTASSAANHPFQHLAAYGAKHALWKVSKECYTDRASPMYQARGRPLLFAHDEIIAEFLNRDRGLQTAAAYRQAEVMRNAMREFVPDVHVGAEPALMPRWYKSAEALKDEHGHLVPWTPEVAAVLGKDPVWTDAHAVKLAAQGRAA